MKFGRITALLLCAVLVIAPLTGCGQGEKVSNQITDGTDTQETDTPETATDAAGLDITGAYASLEPDTVMMTVGDREVGWRDLFYLINYYIGYAEYYGGDITDWSAVFTDEMSYEDYVKSSAAEWMIYSQALETNAAPLGAELSDEDAQTVQDTWDEMVADYGSEDAFMADLEANFCTPEFFNYITEVNCLYENCVAALYGEEGETLTDADLADYYAADGYMMAKHILVPTTRTDEEGSNVDMTEAEAAAQFELAEDLLERLNNYEGDDFDGFFDELMNEYSEDSAGLSSYPDGYLFQSGEMVEEFENAYQDLEEGEYSDLVESEFGYHIIYRIPIDYDTVPYAYYMSGYDFSLRYMAAQNMFSSALDGWMEDVNIVYSEAYNALDFSELFG